MSTEKLTSLLKNSGKPKIAVFRALQIGDLLCAIPAIRSLKMAIPNAHITLIGLPWSQDFVKRFDKYFDDFLEFPGFPGLPEREYSPQEVVDFIDRMQKEKFDLCLQMQGDGSIVNPLIELFGAKYIAGFYRPGDYRPSELFLKYPDNLHEIRRHLELTKHLGILSQGEDLEFPILDRELSEFYEKLIDWRIIPQRYVCLHVGSRADDRRWKIENFAQVGDFVASLGYRVVLTGSKEEKGLVEKAAKLMNYPSLNLAGQTSLGVAAALIQHARLLIANDTGVSHIACGLQVPSVIIFSASDPNRWAPLDISLHSSILKDQATVQNVISQVRQQLDRSQEFSTMNYQGVAIL